MFVKVAEQFIMNCYLAQELGCRKRKEFAVTVTADGLDMKKTA